MLMNSLLELLSTESVLLNTDSPQSVHNNFLSQYLLFLEACQFFFFPYLSLYYLFVQKDTPALRLTVLNSLTTLIETCKPPLSLDPILHLTIIVHASEILSDTFPSQASYSASEKLALLKLLSALVDAGAHLPCSSELSSTLPNLIHALSSSDFSSGSTPMEGTVDLDLIQSIIEQSSLLLHELSHRHSLITDRDNKIILGRIESLEEQTRQCQEQLAQAQTTINKLRTEIKEIQPHISDS